MSATEAEKLAQHLALLRSEYVKLQQKCSSLERENALLLAQTGGQAANRSFVGRLVATVAGLYNRPLYSDLTILTPASSLHAHKFVLGARSGCWRVSSLTDVDSLDWRDLGEDVSLALLNWVYTDVISFTAGEKFTLALMAAASQFELLSLMEKCEDSLVSSVSVSNCISFYATAHKIAATRLKEHCSQLISSNWDSFSAEDFLELAPELVYEMLKAKARYPLHSAIQLRREDVVFLYLIEYSGAADLALRINQSDDAGRLPLDMALASAQYGIANSLLEHQVNLNQMDVEGRSLLHLAILRLDPGACLFLLKHGAQLNLQTRDETRDSALHLIARTVASEAAILTEVAETIVGGVGSTSSTADINLQNAAGETPLMVAIQHGNAPTFQLLLDRGANLELTSLAGKPVLWYALQLECGGEEFPEAGQLVAAGADVNAVCSPGGDTLLHSLARQGREAAALFLLGAGAAVGRVNRRGESVLHLAAQGGLATLATALLVAGADPNLQTGCVPTAAAASGAEIWRQTALHLALLHRQEAVVSCLLEFAQEATASDGGGLASVPLDINLKNSADETPLGLALNEAELRHLAGPMLAAGADLDVRDRNGLTLLQKAIGEGNTAAALFLLHHGADINLRTPQGLTPLELAVRNQAEEVVEKLCLAGADTTASSTGENPLWIALDLKSLDMASILVRHGVDTDAWAEGPDGCQQTLLHRAIDENNEEVACFLIRSGCDLNAPRRPGPGGQGGEEAADGQGPLHLAAQWGQEEVVTALIEHGANINLQDAEGKSPLHHAIEAGQQGIINMLLGCPNINLSARDRAGLSPFACAMTFKNNSAARVILELEPGAAEQPDARGKNFLHTAIMKGDLESLLFLLSIHVNVQSKTTDANKLSPLLLGVQVGKEMMVRNLLLAGANVQERTLSGQNALHLAAESDLPEIVSVLLNNGIDFSAVDEAGNNALHLAVREGNVRTARVLLTESRINAEALNNKGRSPFHVLAQFGENNTTAIFDLFLECMPEYPIDKPDTEGNTPLLLAYVKGSGDLCRALVKRGAILGTMNKNMVNIFNHPVATKQLLYRLLDLLSAEPRWGEGDFCEECQAKFGLTIRKHHCRHCGRLLCGKCSAKEMPIIKYNLTKPVRVCAVCADLLTLGVGAGH